MPIRIEPDEEKFNRYCAKITGREFPGRLFDVLIDRDRGIATVSGILAGPLDLSPLARGFKKDLGLAARLNCPSLERETREAVHSLFEWAGRRHPALKGALGAATFNYEDGCLSVRVPGEGWGVAEGLDLAGILRRKLPEGVEVRVECGEVAGPNPLEELEEEIKERVVVSDPALAREVGRRETAVLYGRGVKGEPVPIRGIDGSEKGVVVAGSVFSLEKKELKGGTTLFTFAVTDGTDSIAVKAFRKKSDRLDDLRDGDYVLVQGKPAVDRYSEELTITAAAVKRADRPRREDDSERKRVELHLHTRMSAMDAVLDLKEAAAQAAAWGHRALAVTDHGVVQAFPEAYEASRAFGLKIIYGVEGYLIGQGDNLFHVIILARSQTGLRNLYRLISLSHLDHFYRRPRIPRELLQELREGLIVGSACEAGELFRAILAGKPDEEVRSIASFYDYLEIQPVENNLFLVSEGRVSSEEEIKEINARIVSLGKELGKIVVATGDVHFLEPGDAVYRRILLAGQGYADADRDTPLYLRTTGEMLEAFAYLGEELAREVVIENTNLVASWVDDGIRPVPEELHSAHLPGAEEKLRELVYTRARELYGEQLPPPVEARLKRELDSVIENGYAGIYYIAHLLVKKSLSDGYLVGSRGSVGSSLVATMASITEVNPLPPHYRCPKCRRTIFVEGYGSGFDLPGRDCPDCGSPMEKDGQDIPFETFLGFEGDKVPDIDLNFSGDYQPVIHRYTESLLGEKQVFRAGTIATIAERTAYGFVKKYCEERGLRPRSVEIERLSRGIVGVKRTTGQHPGGLMVVPENRDIEEFTPVQYPADDRKSGVVTTHFDYHSITGRLTKLDILGHDDPTTIRMLQDLTGVDVFSIPFDDPETMALFSGTESLGVSPEQIGCEVGTLGIPEFGTRFVRQMLVDTRPRTFAELVRISGLSHGTDVWLNNAQELVRSGTATLSEVISTRDDIMIYLLEKGLEKKTAFNIMERVRKGKGLREEDVEAMRAGGVPQWYIESCQKISYMFPKAHAAAYVMMAFRIAYFKVHHPAAFYAAYFTVRGDEFDAEVLCADTPELKERIAQLERQGSGLSARDKGLLTLLEVAVEMKARGISLLPVSLWESSADSFLVTPEGLRPPLSALAGVGAAAAEGIVRAREEGPFLSVEDLRNRSGANRSVIEVLQRAGCLRGLPETNQITFFSSG